MGQEDRGRLIFDETTIENYSKFSFRDGSKLSILITTGSVYFGSGLVWFITLLNLNLETLYVSIIALITLITFTISEKRARRSFVPIKVYENGIELNSSFWEKRRGLIDFVPLDDIDTIEVVRGQSADRVDAHETWIYDWAPIELKIRTRTNEVRYTGRKRRMRTMVLMMKAIEEHWGLPMEDCCDGLGKFTRYVDSVLVPEVKR